MIRLVFTYNKEPMNFIVKDRAIFYSDRKFSPNSWIRCMPPPENFVRLVALSRNRVPASLINMFKFTEEEVKEYESCKTEDELAEMIIKDAKSKGLLFHNKLNELTEEDQKKGVIT